MKKLWSYIAIPCTALAVFTGSIAWVLLLRPFYYAQIAPLGICESSGLTAAPWSWTFRAQSASST